MRASPDLLKTGILAIFPCMTTESLRPNLPEEEDSWTDLAEDLFGIDFAQTPESGEFVPPEELLSVDDPVPLDSEESNDPAVSDEAEQSEEAEHSSLSGIEAEAQEQETAPSIQDIPAEREETGEEDTFWDPLNTWNWDEGKAQTGRIDRDSRQPERSRRKPSSFEREKPVSSHIVRGDDDFSSTEELREEYSDDSDFGSGLLADEAEPVSDSEISDSSGAQTEQAEETPSKPQRSRRRRRRPRRAKEDSGDVETVSTGDEKIEVKEEASGGEGSTGQDDAAEETPRKRPARRRRSSRGRGKRSDSPAAESESQTSEPIGESEEFGASILDDELEPVSEESSDESQDLPSEPEAQSKATHRDVPSWEEAISYLLSPPKLTAEAQSASKTSPSSTATKDSTESSKPPARRRRRRR
jgi:hypothetical protein